MEKPKSASAQRCLLIAMPNLLDPNFNRTATLISEFNEEGAMGLILNRPTNLKLEDILIESSGIVPKALIPVYWGGPVQTDRGWIVHEDASLASESTELAPGLYMSSSLPVLKKMAESGTDTAIRYRFFLGYAGWSAGQLEHEMASSSWVTAPIDRGLIFDDKPDSLWERSLQSIGVNPASLASGGESTEIQ